ncbi:MAG: signal peptide peptidase SppA [Acidobacteria bacterium RIFCSPLOWO2_12_FULL_67_14b]|nr:MAG: signal peptide peptidase SppA [Acidobacteria bacterium RIFCSPLOWO2_12_FULL_67_14b]
MKRGVGFVFGFLLVAALASAAAMLVLYLAVGAEPPVGAHTTLVLRPHGDLPEVLPDVVFGAGDELSIRAYVELIRKAKADTRIAGILLKPGSLDSPFWARVQELRDAIDDFKGSGKYVYAWLEYAGDREYYLASVADRVYLLPSASLDLTGIASYEVFLRGTFDWIGTYPDFLHVGDYKTAVNTYLEKSFSPAHREMSESLNRSQYQQLVRGIADGRQKREDEVRALIDQGPFQPVEALRVGLIDDVAYEDELDDLHDDLAGEDHIDAEDYAAVSWNAAGVRRGATIAVINVVGTINSGHSGYDPVNGPVIGSDSLVEYIREARANDAVKAIVLRVDSPGGSSTASDVIWRELSISRENDRPLIVSMSDLAASGGYYIALAGDAIVAQPGTLTGSIGVYTGKFVTTGTLDKIGANLEATSSGKRAQMNSPDRRFTADERAKIQEAMQVVYDQFVERTAAARHMAPEKVDEVAQGRVWTGEQARELGLVDQLGGLYTAIGLAKQRARIPADEEVQLLIYPPRRSFYEVLAEELQSPVGRMADASTSEAIIQLLGPRERRALAALLAPSRLFRSGQVLAHMPYVFVR